MRRKLAYILDVLAPIAVIASAIIWALMATGCSAERQASEARAASNIWHAAEYLERAGSDRRATLAIKASAEAIAQSNNHEIQPAGAELVLPQLRQQGGQ